MSENDDSIKPNKIYLKKLDGSQGFAPWSGNYSEVIRDLVNIDHSDFTEDRIPEATEREIPNPQEILGLIKKQSQKNKPQTSLSKYF